MKKKIILALSSLALSTVLLFSHSANASNLPTWKFENNVWKYHKEDGSLAKSWLKLNDEWYYLDVNTGTMKTGWINLKGKWYFLNTVKDSKEGKMFTGWHWIDGYCYYFDETKDSREGEMLANRKTPDGYMVNSDGRWVNSDNVPVFVKGKGIITKKSDLNSSATKKGKTSGGGFYSGGGSYSGGSSSSNTGNNLLVDAELELVNKAHTKIVDLGFAQYVTISLKEGNKDAYTFLINDVDVSSDVSLVNTEGTFLKWASTINLPKKLSVIRKSDLKKEDIELLTGVNKEAPRLANKSLSPKYIISNGPISVFDYHLDVYDEEGNVRTKLKRTTFNFEEEVKEVYKILPKRYFTKDVEIDTQQRGRIEVKFLLDDDSKTWFDNISEVEILSSSYASVTKPTYHKSKEEDPEKAGIIHINLPQHNFRTTGRYYLKVLSSVTKASYVVPIHIIKATDFKLVQSAETPDPDVENPDVLFKVVSDTRESFGNDIVNPIYRVVLTYPDKTEKDLENIKEYSLIGEVLSIRGKRVDRDTNEEVRLISEAGTYKITVYAHGYKTLSKTFTIADTLSSGAVSTNSFDDIDIVSMATGVGSVDSSGSSSGGAAITGSNNINANLLFDYDLIVNALILNKFKIPTTDSSAVITRYFTKQSPEIIATEDLSRTYDLEHFMDKVKEAQLNNRMYIFEDYINDETAKLKNPTSKKLKRVLEDGALAPVEDIDDIILDNVGKKVGNVEGTSANEEEDFTLTFENSEYLANISSISLNGVVLDNTSYRIEANKLIITKETVKQNSSSYVGRHKLQIEADGYQRINLDLTVNEILEVFELELLTQNPRLGQEIEIKASQDSGELKGKFLQKPLKVTLVNSNNEERVLHKKGAESLNVGYEVVDNKIVLANKTFKVAGTYNIVIKAEGYPQKNIVITIEDVENPENPEDNATLEEKDAFLPISSTKNSFYGSTELIFTNSEEISDYLKLLADENAEFKVDDVKYTYKIGTGFLGQNQFGIKRNDSGINSNIEKIVYYTPARKDTYKIEIIVPGYKKVEFELTDAGKINSSETDSSANSGTSDSSSEDTGASTGNGSENTDSNAGSTTEDTGSGEGSGSEGTDESSGSSTEENNKKVPPTPVEKINVPESFGASSKILIYFEDTEDNANYLNLLKQEGVVLKLNEKVFTYGFPRFTPDKFGIIKKDSNANRYNTALEFYDEHLADLPNDLILTISLEGYEDLTYSFKKKEDEATNTDSEESTDTTEASGTGSDSSTDTSTDGDSSSSGNSEDATEGSQGEDQNQELKNGFAPTRSTKNSFEGSTELIFTNSEEISEYLSLLANEDAEFKVDDVKYTYRTTTSFLSQNQFGIKRNDSGINSNVEKIVYATPSRKDKYKIEIIIPGYKKVEFELMDNGTINVVEEAEEEPSEEAQEDTRKTPPSPRSKTEVRGFFDSSILINFEDTEEVVAYFNLLNNPTSVVKLNDVVFTKGYIRGSDKKFDFTKENSNVNRYDSSIRFNPDHLRDLPDEITLTITAEGYKDLTYSFRK